MTILVDHQISAFHACKKIGIEPFDQANIQPNSYDLHLADDYQISVDCGTLDPYDKVSIRDAFVGQTADQLFLEPGGFILGSTVETITLPADVVGMVEGKSSLARLGITIHQTGGYIDAGFTGRITLEISNCHPSPVKLTAGMPIAQIVFCHTQPADKPYSGKYQHQEHATLSRYHLNGQRRGIE